MTAQFLYDIRAVLPQPQRSYWTPYGSGPGATRQCRTARIRVGAGFVPRCWRQSLCTLREVRGYGLPPSRTTPTPIPGPATNQYNHSSRRKTCATICRHIRRPMPVRIRPYRTVLRAG
eukprot:2737392-Rhodomonas_salina.2